MLIVAKAPFRQACRHHGALGFAQVPALEVKTDHVTKGVVSVISHEPWLDARRDTGSTANLAIENLPLVKDHRLAQAVLADVIVDRGNLLGIRFWEQMCKRMELVFRPDA